MAHGSGSEVRKRKTKQKGEKSEQQREKKGDVRGDAAAREHEDGEQSSNSEPVPSATSAASDGGDRPRHRDKKKKSHQKQEKSLPLPQQQRKVDSGTYWLTRIVFIRALGLVYFAAFLVCLNQNKGLMGRNGLLPIPNFMARMRDHFKVPANTSTTQEALLAVPTVMWWVSEEDTDLALDCIAYTGLSLSAFLMLVGGGNALIFATLWALYHSIVNVGQRWYSFGWESQLLETGFLAIFLSPLFSVHPLPRSTPTPWAVIWGYRWLIFRIILGAGLIKIRGDQCWRDLTCMNYHYQTQPVPNPLSYFLHQSPEVIHQLETLGNHAIEIGAPFLVLLPRPYRLLGGSLQILFQVILILSGNLSFLNWLTLIPAIHCFDDKSLYWLFPSSTKQRVLELQQFWKRKERRPLSWYIRQPVSLALALLLAYLSLPVLRNMLSPRQVMNTSFDSLRLVNTYGAFGSITKERTEVVLEGTYNATLGDYGEAADWLEVEFHCKPGAIDRRPCIISPYHYRLDWLMWFAAFQTYQQNPWFLNLAGKILAGDPSVNSLIAHNPFANKPPLYVRALHYRYRYTALGSEEAGRGEWWSRELLDNFYMPIVAEEHLRPYVESWGWKWYTPDDS